MDTRRRAFIFIVPFAAIFALGLIGLERVDPQGNLSHHAYRILQLFALEGDWTTSLAQLPWEVQLARFLAPVATVASVAWVFATSARVAVVNFLARFRRHHIVAVGLNERSWHFLSSCAREGRRTSVIALQSDTALINECRRRGLPVFAVDAITDGVLLRAGVHRAHHLVVMTEDDGSNVEITLRVKQLLLSRSQRRPLNIMLHLDDTHLAGRLEDYPKFFEDYEVAEVSFFNVHERSARALFAEQPVEVYADVLGLDRVHLAIFGDGPLADEIILHGLRNCHYADFGEPRISVYCVDPERARRRFESDHPRASRAGDLRFVAANLDLEELGDALPPAQLADASMYVVTLDDDVRTLDFALTLRRAVLGGLGPNAPILAAMQHTRGLAQLLESSTGDPEVPDGLFPFGLLDQVLDVSHVVDQRQDTLARAIHAAYVDSLDHTGSAFIRASQRPWDQLPEVFRRENRIQADHLEIKLRSVRRRLVSGHDARSFSASEREQLAHMEKERWLASRYAAGWRPGPQRNDLEKVHDLMRPWAELTESERDFDRSSIDALPAMLKSQLDLVATREVVIGVTGHRLNKIDPEDTALRGAIVRTLHAIRSAHPGACFSVLSPLAEGADRLVARLAMEVLDARLDVPLPLPYELYIADFGSSTRQSRSASVREFRRMVGRARRYFELPLKFGTYAQLDLDSGSARRARQYALAGAYIAQRADEMLAVWDGCEQEGEGGTGQIVEWRRSGAPEDDA